MAMSSGDFTLQEAADQLEVHYMTAYRYVRLGLLPARKVDGSWRVSKADLEAFHTPAETPTSRGEAPWSKRLESRMIAGDAAGAWSVVEAALASGTEPARIYTDVLTPALRSIGERWRGGDIGIEDEHIASAVAARLVGRLGSRFNRRGRSRGTVVIAAPAGERHALGLAMVGDILRSGGYDVLDLGADTPSASLVEVVQRTDGVVAIVLTAVASETIDTLRDAIRAVRASVGPELPILVGGRAIESEDHARSLGASAYSVDPTFAPQLIAELSKKPRSA